MCDHHSAAANPSVHQTLEELDFQKSLCSAALNGEIDKVREHLQKGTDVNSLDSGGYAPLHYASRAGHIEIVQLLLQQGGNINIRTKSGKATPLLRAAFAGKEKMCRFLVEKGADVRAVDDDGQTVVHRALHSGNLFLTKYLLSIAPELKSQADKRGKTPLDLTNCDL